MQLGNRVSIGEGPGAAPVMAAIKVSFRALPPQIDTHQFSI
jgi:hypothetical protein